MFHGPDELLPNDYLVVCACAKSLRQSNLGCHFRKNSCLRSRSRPHVTICYVSFFKQTPLIKKSLPHAAVLRRFIPLARFSEPFLRPAERLTAVFQIKRLRRACEERSFSFFEILQRRGKKRAHFDIGLGGLDCCSVISNITLNVADTMQ